MPPSPLIFEEIIAVLHRCELGTLKNIWNFCRNVELIRIEPIRARCGLVALALTEDDLTLRTLNRQCWLQHTRILHDAKSIDSLTATQPSLLFRR